MGKLRTGIISEFPYEFPQQLYSDDRHGKMRDLEIISDPDPQNILSVFLKPLFICYVIALQRYKH